MTETSPRSSLGLQKVCDIHDLFHPEIDRILREELRSVPFGSRRAWEFAMIFRALQAKGRLHARARGLGLGAGTERLIYALARRAGELVVTDLYTHAGGWEGVRTADPKGLVMSKAPWPVDAQRIEVRSMDMREIDFPDESFDFCWSTGAIEHIGDDRDFARHFAEVHRVLRPGGVYAFTTAIVFGSETLRIPHNYYFDPEHLIDLIHASPLHAEPQFDCRVTDHLFNRPHIERFQDYGFAGGNQLSKPIVSFRRGALLAANAMVLTKLPAEAPKRRPAVVGYAQASKQVRRHADNLTTHLWKDWQWLRGELRGRRLTVQPQYFGAGRVTVDVTLAPGAPAAVLVTVRSRGITDFGDWQIEHESRVGKDAAAPIELDVISERVYQIAAETVTAAQADRVFIRAKRAGAARAAASDTSPRRVLRSLRDRLDLLRRALT